MCADVKFTFSTREHRVVCLMQEFNVSLQKDVYVFRTFWWSGTPAFRDNVFVRMVTCEVIYHPLLCASNL